MDLAPSAFIPPPSHPQESGTCVTPPDGPFETHSQHRARQPRTGVDHVEVDLVNKSGGISIGIIYTAKDLVRSGYFRIRFFIPHSGKSRD